MSITDLDELLLTVSDRRSREHLDEAVRCYRAGSFRSCIIATWLAVVFDFIYKIEELAVKDDPFGLQLTEKIKRIREHGSAGIRDSQVFESQIPSMFFKDLKLISESEKRDLDRLYEDRHVCAHPTVGVDGYRYDPIAETARMYMVKAVNYVLSSKVAHGRAVEDELWQTVSATYFPMFKGPAKELLKDTYLKDARPSLFRTIMHKLTKAYLSEEAGSRQRLAAILACVELRPDLGNSFIENDLRGTFDAFCETSIMPIAILCAELPGGWEAASTKTKGFIKSALSSTEVDHHLASMIGVCSRIEELKFRSAIRAKQLPQGLLNAAVQIGKSKIFVDPVIDAVRNSGSFRDAEFASSMLTHISRYFNAEISFQLCGAITENEYNQVIHAAECPELIAEVATMSVINDIDARQVWIEFLDSIEESQIGRWKKAFKKSPADFGLTEAK